MFSIVIPLYNKEQTIATTIQSILSQTFKMFEIIVINDGSTDGCVEVVENINDSRIRLIHQENQGVSVARNKGIELANYDWVVLLDGDDLKHPESLSEYALYIEQYQHINIFSTGYSIINPKSKDRYQNKYLPKDGETEVIDYIECIGAGEPPINSSNSAFRKSLLLESGGFIKGQRNYEDHELWLRIYKENDIVFINKDLTSIRRDLIGTARQNIISVLDLQRYLQTIILTKNSLNGKKLFHFKKFYYKYCMFIFNRIRFHYNQEEIRLILRLMRVLLVWPIYIALKLLRLFTKKKNKI